MKSQTKEEKMAIRRDRMDSPGIYRVTLFKHKENARLTKETAAEVRYMLNKSEMKVESFIDDPECYEIEFNADRILLRQLKSHLKKEQITLYQLRFLKK